MLIEFVTRRLSIIAAVGLLTIPTAYAFAVDESGSSVFQSIGYDYYGSNQSDVPAPVDDAQEQIVDAPAATEIMQPVASTAATCPTACCCNGCTKAKKEALQQAASGAFKGVFYLNDFSYLDDPCYDGWNCGDALKGLCHGHVNYDVGGQVRLRMHREENFRGLGLTGVSDDFLLSRTRVYLNARLSDNVRFYGEVLDANSSYESTPPRPIDENRWDAENLFLDFTLFQGSGSQLVARAGRQELLLGAQRYASPLDWANTRRTFDGGRLLYSNANLSLDGFWLAPVNRDRTDWDEADEDVAFYGVYSSFQATRGTVDYYWLALDDDTSGFYFVSLGSRYNGSWNSLLFEAEAAYQFGTNSNGTDHEAGFFTIGTGKAMADWACKPTTWFYFDWASGANQLGAGNGHDHLFPLAHKYNGFMDLYGRRNLIDVNVLNTIQLSSKVQLLTWFHAFWLENDNDTPYGVTMQPFAPGVIPGDDELGQEIDTILSIGINERTNILFGYSHFWAGDYYATPGLPFDGDANFFYTQYTRNF